MELLIKEKIRDVKLHYKIIFYTSIGILWSISNVGYSFGFLTWFALIPFMLAMKYETKKEALIYSLLFGSVAYFVHLWWMVNPFISYFSNGGSLFILTIVGFLIGMIVTIFISVYHGLVYFLAVFITKYLARKKGYIFYLIFPLVMTSLDYFYPKLWFDNIGYSQYIFLSFSQIADIFGAPFIALIVLYCNSSVIMLVESIFYKKDVRFPSILFGSIIVLVVLGSIYGWFRNEYISDIIKKSPKTKISIIQGNFSGNDKRGKINLDFMINTYNNLTFTELKESPDLVIWPESAVPAFFDEDVSRFNNIKRFPDVPLLFGCHIGEYDILSDEEKVYNSLVLLNDQGVKVNSYYKMKLVPFIEEIPFPFLNFFMKLYGLSSFSRGEEHKILKIKNMKISPNICYEDVIPEFVMKSLDLKGERANLIINATNDSWFGDSLEPKMHLHISGFRSIENRKTLVRSTCTGHSAVFYPTGELVYVSEVFKKDSKTVSVPLMDINTIYNSGGWLFIYILALFVLLIFAYSFAKRFRFSLIRKRLLKATHHKRNLYKMWLE